jgi:tryptophan-rich sensory protein
MSQTTRIHPKPLFISLLITLGGGSLSGYLSASGAEFYEKLTLPPLSPPSVVFPIVWTILYTLIGTAAYLVYVSPSPIRKKALTVYGVSLLVNFSWSFLFFRFWLCLFSFWWLVLLWVLTLWTILLFFKIRKGAGWLLVPYLLWLSFAGYLNFAICLLN